jgi:hexulose-6-phosphate isomerase
MHRRHFLAATAGAAWAAPAPPRFRKSICSVTFAEKTDLAECFRRARAAGFEGLEIRMVGQLTPESPASEVRRLREVARGEGMTIVSMWPYGATREIHLPDAAARQAGVELFKRVVAMAAELGCGELLIVPGRVMWDRRAQLGYEDVWKRSSEALAKVAPAAQQAGVVLGIENVSNKFLLSPLEMRAYIDQFHSPAVGAHLDAGNMMPIGFPQDWIATLGARIRRVHIKDYKNAREGGRYVGLLEGDVDWKGVMAGLVKVGYRGFISPEFGHDAGDPEQVTKLSKALDRILEMA